MSMTTGMLVLLLLLFAVLFVMRRKGQNSAKNPKTKTPVRPAIVKSSEYHAVSIKLAQTACDAARKIAGQRFLSNNAPALPLSDCNMVECECHFVHHTDRRIPSDRRSAFNTSIGVDSGSFKKEQRESRDDRRDDARDDDLF